LKNVTLQAIAKRNDLDVHQLLLVWCLKKGFVVIPRSSNEERQTRNIMLEGLDISASDVAEMDNLGKKSTDQVFKQCWNSKDIV